MKFTGEELSTGCIRTFAANLADPGADREDRIQVHFAAGAPDAGPDSAPRPHWLRACIHPRRDICLRKGAEKRPAPAENRYDRVCDGVLAAADVTVPVKNTCRGKLREVHYVRDGE